MLWRNEGRGEKDRNGKEGKGRGCGVWHGIWHLAFGIFLVEMGARARVYVQGCRCSYVITKSDSDSWVGGFGSIPRSKGRGSTYL